MNATPDRNHGLGRHLRALRRMASMTQADVGARCGLTRTSIANIEAGKQPLTAETMHLMAAAGGCRVRVHFERAPQLATAAEG
mgnify:CR=1 FL=1